MATFADGHEVKEQGDKLQVSERSLPDIAAKIHEEIATSQDSMKVEAHLAQYAAAVSRAQLAFRNAPAEAQLAFLECYKDTDPQTLATLRLMTGQDQKSPRSSV